MALKVEYKTLSPTDISNGYVVLTGMPVDGTVAFDIISGMAQAQSTDFGVTDATVLWNNGYLLNGDMSANDQIRIIYDKSST